MATHTMTGLFLSISLLTVPTGATTIIAILQRAPSGTRIVIGADGLQGRFDRSDRPYSIQICKIQHAGNYYYAASGPVVGPDFDVYIEIQVALTSKGSFADRVKLLERNIVGRMNSIKYWPAGQELLEIIIIDSSQFPTHYYGGVHRASGIWSLTPKTSLRTALPDNTDTTVYRLGLADHVNINDLFNGKSNVAQTRDWIKLEERQHPGSVGEPISIIEFTGAGPKWLERGACK